MMLSINSSPLNQFVNSKGFVNSSERYLKEAVPLLFFPSTLHVCERFLLHQENRKLAIFANFTPIGPVEFLEEGSQ